MFNEMRWTSRWLDLDTLFTMNIGGVYQRRLYLRDAIYEVLDTHLRDSSIVYYEYFWILLETSRNYKICSSGLAAADADLQDCLARYLVV